MTSHLPHPLTTEERVPAARLARVGPHGEPSPVLLQRDHPPPPLPVDVRAIALPPDR